MLSNKIQFSIINEIMNRFLLFLIPILLVFSGCNSVPPEEPDAQSVPVSQIAAEVSDDQSSAPSSTVEVVIDSQQERSAAYPEPEAVESYPEPEAAESSAYPAPESAVVRPPNIAGAGDVEVVFVKANLTGENEWSFSVTLEHEDTGWEDYADGWDVVLPDGTVIKPNPADPFTRLLLHPHENEQPFTRSQSGIIIPADVSVVFVRGHELVEGYGSSVVAVDLNALSGDRFEVTR